MAADEHDDHRGLTRRQALRAGAGACAGGAAMLGLLGPVADQAVADQLKRYGRSAVDPVTQNAILIVTDSTRADYLGAYGSRRGLTPNLDALARDGLTFTRAHPESMPTGPARDTLLTGDRQFPFRNWHPEPNLPSNPGWNSIPSGEPTFLELLDRHGVTTAYVTDNPFLVGPRYTRVQRRTDHFVGFEGQTAVYSASHRAPVPTSQVQRFLPPSLRGGSGAEAALALYLAYAPRGMAEDDYFTARVFKAAIDLIDTLRQHQPFVLVVDGFDPHEPWDPPDKYVKLHGGDVNRAWDPGTVLNGTTATNGLAPADVAQMKALYRAELSMSDHWFGNFMQRFHELGLERETLILFLSDHGFLLGERGYVAKMATQCHPELIHVPLMIRSPDGRGAGRTTDYLTQTQDVATTLLHAGTVRRPDFMDGQNLLPLLEGRHGKRRLKKRTYVTGSYSSIVFARDRRWSYMGDNQNADPQLFDHERDPREVHDLAAARPDRARRMYERMVVRDNGGRALPRFA